MASTDIKDYYRRAWGLGDRVPFKHGGTWADWKVNYEDQMSFEEYLQDDKITKKIQAIDKRADGGVARQPFAPENVERVANKKFYHGTALEASALPDNIKKGLERKFPQVKFDWSTGGKYGIAGTDISTKNVNLYTNIYNYVNRNLSTDPTYEPKPTKELREKKINIKEAIKEKIKNPFAKIIVDNYVKQFKTSVDAVEEVIADLKTEGHQIRTKGGPEFNKAQTKYFLDNYKSKSLSQMAKGFSKKGISGKALHNIYNQFRYIKEYALTNNIVNQKNIFVYRAPKLKVKTPQWQSILAKQAELMKKDPKLKGYTPATLEYELRKFTNMRKIENALDPRLKPDNPLAKTKTQKGVKIWPSFEHTQGSTPSIIIEDPEGLKKVRISTQKYNFDILGANDKKGLYKIVKDNLKSATAALKIGNTAQAIEDLSEVNQIYHELAKTIKVKRTDLPLYYVDGKTIKEKNVKGVVKQETLYKSFSKYLNEAAAVATETDLKRIDKIQPNLSTALRLIKDGKTEAATKFIKLRMPAIKAGDLFSFAGFADVSPIIPKIELSPQLSKVLSKTGSVLKGAGVIAAPLNLIPYAQQVDRGMGMRSIDTGTARLMEDFVNMPKYVTQLAGMLLKKDWDLPYEAKFGRMYADWVAEGIPLKERIKKIEELGTQTLDDESIKALSEFTEKKFGTSSAIEGERGYSPERTAMLKEKASKPLLPPRGDLEIKETENVFGTQIPMKNITEPEPLKKQWLNKGGLSGVDNYILNRYK